MFPFFKGQILRGSRVSRRKLPAGRAPPSFGIGMSEHLELRLWIPFGDHPLKLERCREH